MKIRVALLFLLFASLGWAQVDLSGSGTNILPQNGSDNAHGKEVGVPQVEIPERDEEREKAIFESALRQYELGSYYEAVNSFSKLIGDKDSPFYAKSLLMSGKVYLQIGKKTGANKYLWSAISFMNLYSGEVDELDWDYYYIKGQIYENLLFQERAQVFYKRALLKADSQEERTKALIALLRVSVGLQKVDRTIKYLILDNLENMKKSERAEYDFIMGMDLFLKKRYDGAYSYFMKTFREYEHYLISNPQYYYLVAENAYRTGNLKFSEHLFRRIIALTKSKEVIRKSMLRMADISLRFDDAKSALNYYYLLVSKFPESDEALVAKLKLIHMMDDPGIKAKLVDSQEKAFKEPESFIIKTLVKNRTNYIGRFAIGNFGDTVLKMDSDVLYERLEWELSLIGPPRLDFEQKEYIASLWLEKLMESRSAPVCRLYKANPQFFQEIFDQGLLVKISDDLKQCNDTDSRLDLLRFVSERWDLDENRLRLARSLFEYGRYEDSLGVLNLTKDKGCPYAKLQAKNYILTGKNQEDAIDLVAKNCAEEDIEAMTIVNFGLLHKNDLRSPFSFVLAKKEYLLKQYNNDDITNRFIDQLLSGLIAKEEYRRALEILDPLTREVENNCFLNSLLLLCYVRNGKMENAKQHVDRINECDSSWVDVAMGVYRSSKLEEGLKYE